MTTSVIIPTVDRPGAAAKVVAMLERQTRHDFDIVVVDQSAAEDATLRNSRINLVRIAERGLPNARNVGARAAGGDILIFLDDDVEPDARLVECHVRHYADPRVMGVAGRIRGGYDEAPGGRAVGRLRRWDVKIFRNFDSDAACDVEHLPGGNMSVRRSALEAVGGFDSSYGGSSVGEETDFSLRVRAKLGREIAFRFDPEAWLFHNHMATGGCRSKTFREWLFWNGHNVMLFALRHGRGVTAPVVVLQRAVRFLAFAIEHGDPPLVGIGLLGVARGVSRHWRTAPR